MCKKRRKNMPVALVERRPPASNVLPYDQQHPAGIGEDSAVIAAKSHGATKLNPNLAIALAYRSIALALTGEPEAAIEDAAKALRLSPVDPSGHLAFAGITIAKIALNEYDEAAIAARKTIDMNPRFPMAYAWGIVAECGRGDKAQADFRLQQLEAIIPGFNPEGLPGLCRPLLKGALLDRRQFLLSTIAEGEVRVLQPVRRGRSVWSRGAPRSGSPPKPAAPAPRLSQGL